MHGTINIKYRNIHIDNWSSVNLTILESRGAQIVQKYGIHIKIVGGIKLTAYNCICWLFIEYNMMHGTINIKSYTMYDTKYEF